MVTHGLTMEHHQRNGLFVQVSSIGRHTKSCLHRGHDSVSAGIIERKLRSTKVRLFTVPCCSIILFSSEGVKKTYLNLLLTFFVVL